MVYIIFRYEGMNRIIYFLIRGSVDILKFTAINNMGSF